MTWIKLDDGLPEHRKVLRAGVPAAWLFVAGLCYCSRQLSDGVIPKEAACRLIDLPAREAGKAASRLVEAGLWVDDGDVFVVHEYGVYQRSAASVEAERAADRLRKRRMRSNGAESP